MYNFYLTYVHFRFIFAGHEYEFLYEFETSTNKIIISNKVSVYCSKRYSYIVLRHAHRKVKGSHLEKSKH